MDGEYLIKLNSFLIFICLMGLVFIGALVYHISNLSNDINRELMDFENKIPKCPKCELKCPVQPEKECPECEECDKGSDSPSSPSGSPGSVECPTVNDIVTGIFPGRNPKVVDGGRYFKVDAGNTYDGLSTSNFYKQEYNFPMEKLLKPDTPLRDYNISGENTIDNSIENNNTSYSQKSVKMSGGPIPSNTHSNINYSESIDEMNNIPVNQS